MGTRTLTVPGHTVQHGIVQADQYVLFQTAGPRLHAVLLGAILAALDTGPHTSWLRGSCLPHPCDTTTPSRRETTPWRPIDPVILTLI